MPGVRKGTPGGARARTFSSDWALGEPDLTLTMPEPYHLAAAGSDDFRVFVLKTNFPEDRWIRAVDFHPGNRSVVHHIIAGVDPSGRGRELDEADPGPGYFDLGGFGDGVPISAFLPIWTPGAKSRYCPDGTGYMLPKGADILIQVHYHKTGKPETDATSVGLYLSEKPLPREVHTGFVFPKLSLLQGLAARAKVEEAQKAGKRIGILQLLREVDAMVIPAGSPNFEVKASTKPGANLMGRPLDRDILITSVMPHMHWLGKDFTFSAVLPDGKTRIPLIKIDHWNFNWQGTYAFKEPIRVPKGSWFEVEAHFDNSDDESGQPEQTSQDRPVGRGDRRRDGHRHLRVGRRRGSTGAGAQAGPRPSVRCSAGQQSAEFVEGDGAKDDEGGMSEARNRPCPFIISLRGHDERTLGFRQPRQSSLRGFRLLHAH